MANTNNKSGQGKPKESSSSVDDPLSMFLIDAEPGATTATGGAGAGGDESEDALRMAEDMMNSIVQDMGDDLGEIDLSAGENDGTTTNNLEDINIDSFLDVEEDDQHDAVVVVNSTSSSNATTSDVKADGSGMNKAIAARCIDDDAMMFHSSELDDLENDEANQSDIDLSGGDDTQETGGVEGNSRSMNGDGNESSIGVDYHSSPHVVKLPPSPKGQKGMGHSLKKKAAKMATSFCSPSRSSSQSNKEGSTIATNTVVEDPLWNTGSSPLRPGMDTTETARTRGTSGRSSAAGRSHPFSSSSSAAVGQHDHPLGGVSSSSSSNPLESIKKAGSSAFSQATASSSTFGSLFQKAAANISSFTASADAALSSVVTHQPHSSSAPMTMSHPSSPDSEDMQHSSGGGHDGGSSSSRRTMMMMMDDNFQLLQNPAIQSQLLTMALGGSNSKPLHQGERIILFLPHVVNVATSSSPVSGVASSATIVAATGSSNSGSSALSSQQLWAMCITFYRIILFNYTLSQVEQLMGTAPGCVTSDAASVASGKPSSGGSKTDGGSTEESGDDQQSSPLSSNAVAGGSSSGCSMSTAARQGLDNAILRAGLSRQWQYHHASHQHDKRGGDDIDNDGEAADSAVASPLPFKHFVLQLPLGAIDRVEKGDVPYSMASNSTVLSNSMNFASSAGRAGSSSNMNGMNNHAQQSAGGGSRSQSNHHLGSESHRTSSDGMMMNGSNSGTTTAATPMTTAQQTIVLYDKGGSNRWIRFTSVNLADAIRAHEALSTYAFPGKRNLGYLFAFEACREQVLALNQGSSSSAAQPAPSVGESSKSSETSNSINNKALPNNSRYKPLKEFARMGITAAGGGTNSNMVGRYAQPQPWTITHANVNYHLCSSYPSILVVPTCASPEVSGDAGRRLLTQCASFRSERRLPVLAWGNGTDAASIWRCSQPKVGLGGNRNSGDEVYLKALSETAGRYIKHSTMKLPPAYTRLLTGANDAESDVLSFLKVQIKAVTLSSAGVSSSSSSRTGSNDKRSPQSSSASKTSHVRISSSGGSSKSGNSSSPTGYSKNDNSYATSNTTTTVPLGLPPLKIMDLRPKSAAMANRTQGYGYESSSNYPQGQVSFYNIANIHGVRDSLGKLSSLAMNPVTQDINFSGLVESTGWLTLIRTILNASWQCAAIVNFHRLPVLLHCSHGWDRTSQVSALAQLMLDSYYRTMKGFAVLVEKEFGSFGHPFHLRCGHGEGSAGDFYTGSGGQSTTGTGQRSPIFLQFIDCVWQLVNQFPTFFEFNTRYLLVICDHIYSCRFGTFLCDNERERIAAGIYERTQSLWDYLDDIEESTRRSSGGTTTTTTIFTNPFYNSMTNLLIPPLPCLLRQVTLWSDYHLRYSPRAYLTCLPIDLVPYVVPSSSTNGTVLEEPPKEGDAQEEKASDKDKVQASSYLPNELTTLFCSRDEQDATLHKLAEELTRMKRLCQQQELEIAKLKQQDK